MVARTATENCDLLLIMKLKIAHHDDKPIDRKAGIDELIILPKNEPET